MDIYFTIVKSVDKYKMQYLRKNYYHTTINNDKLTITCYPQDFKIAYVFNSYNVIENNTILLAYQEVNISIDSFVISDQLYLKHGKYCINENRFMNKNNLFLYDEILKKDKNLIEINTKLLIDLLNKYTSDKNPELYVLKLKHKYYLNLITHNYYYIFRIKNNSFKLIKKFKYWYNFAIDEKYNLYSINSLLQIFKVPKSFSRYNEFVNIIENTCGRLNDFLYDNNKWYGIGFENITYSINYKKNKPVIKKIIIDFDLQMRISLIISKRIYFKYERDYYFCVAFII